MKRQLNPKKNGSLCDGHFSVKDCRWSLKEAICLTGKYHFSKKRWLCTHAKIIVSLLGPCRQTHRDRPPLSLAKQGAPLAATTRLSSTCDQA